MNQELFTRGQGAVARGLGWLRGHTAEIAQVPDFDAHYKALYLWAAVGDPVRARQYADLMRTRYLQEDGDFRAGPLQKGWVRLPIMPANRYLYPNGWIIVGLRRLGGYGLAERGIQFVRRFQSPELGGFFSRFDLATGEVDRRYLDSNSTSAAGLALLACGYVEEARRAGDFVLRLLEAQPEPERHLYVSWEAGAGLMTDVWGDESLSAMHGRKQFCLSAEADPARELIWFAGKPMKFLAKLYDQTGESRYLEGAIALFDFFHRLGEGRWNNLSACKIMWGSAELYRHTGERRFAETAGRILDWLCQHQEASGVWVHTIFFQRPEDQPLPTTLDVVQELCAELLDAMFDLGPGALESLDAVALPK